MADDKRVSFGRIFISVFKDASDLEADNNELTSKRALVVEEQLIANGISKSKFEIVPNSVVNIYGDPGFADPRIVPFQYRRFVEIQTDKTRFETMNSVPFEQPK